QSVRTRCILHHGNDVTERLLRLLRREVSRHRLQPLRQITQCKLFGDNYLSPLATIKNPHWVPCKTLRRGGLVKRSEPERREWSRSDHDRSGGERSFTSPPRRPPTSPLVNDQL